MSNIFKFIIKYHFVFLFAFLEILSFFLLFQNNNYHGAKASNLGNELTGFFYSKFNDFTQYLSLKEANDKLAEENARLKNLLYTSFKTDTTFQKTKSDSLRKLQYSYIAAKVVHNSINMQNNYLLIDKGKKHGIMPEMAVVCPTGVVGIVKDVSENFSSVISLLNSNLHISAKIKRNDYFGSVSWDGFNYKKAVLNEIPVHIRMLKKDTIITSGYSGIFPEGIMIGFMDEYSFKGGDNFYTTRIKLSTDFKKLHYVYVINNILKAESQKLLE